MNYFAPILFGLVAAAAFYFVGIFIGFKPEASLVGAVFGFLVCIPNMRRIATISGESKNE